MFELPKYVIKAGQMLVEDGEARAPVQGKTLHVAPEYDPTVENDIESWFEQYYSIRFRNYPVSDSYLQDAEKVPCG
jgi:formylmethanofuran dehydrogenase subunit A